MIAILRYYDTLNQLLQIRFQIRLNCNVRKIDITLLHFMSKLLNFLSKKAHFKRKKLHGSFKWTPCGSGKKYKQCRGK